MKTLPPQVLATFLAETRELIQVLQRPSPPRASLESRLATHLMNLASNAEALGFSLLASEARSALANHSSNHVSGTAELAARFERLLEREIERPGVIVREPTVEKEARVFLHPGDLMVLDRPGTLSTILGSCVAVCLWDADAGCGGMNHYLLPEAPANGAATTRTGDGAMNQLLRSLQRKGAVTERLRARVFGGATLLVPIESTAAVIGRRNVETALSFLRENRIPIVQEVTGGNTGMRIHFRIPDGVCRIDRF